MYSEIFNLYVYYSSIHLKGIHPTKVLLPIINEINLIIFHIFQKFHYEEVEIFNKICGSYLRIFCWYVHIIHNFGNILKYLYIVHTIFTVLQYGLDVAYY